jgi:transketolase
MLDLEKLKKTARQVRIETIKAIYQAGSGHPGSSLSTVEILTGLYFGGILKHSSQKPKWEDRDYFILSNGHACPSWYTILAISGYFPMEELSHLREFGHFLQGHPDKSKFELVETTTGSLGQGIAVGLGLALGLKSLNRKNLVYVLESDGEQDEGAVWEVNRIASHYKLNNLKIIIDRNGMQIDNFTEKNSALEPLDLKYESFGFAVKTIDGHNFQDVIPGLGWLKEIKDKPGVLIAKTTRGKGVSFMENSLGYHARSLTKKEYYDALSEL